MCKYDASFDVFEFRTEQAAVKAEEFLTKCKDIIVLFVDDRTLDEKTRRD